jgi:hypothetical protein
MWETPTVNPEDYPCSDSTAYRDNDPTTPEPCKVPVCWYGLMRCEEGKGHAEFQQPSFWEDTSTGKPMPKDCRLQTGGDFTGPHCLSKRPFILLYDISELAAVYRGEKEHNEPQPYAAVPLEAYFRSSSAMGTTYDAEAQRLYLSEGGDHPIVHVFAIGGEEPSAASRSGTAER